MKKYWFNVIVNAFNAAVFGCMVLTGIILKFVLPHGSGGRGRGRVIKTLLGMDRHQWGDFHFYLSVVFFVLIFAHLWLHWNWIKMTFFKRNST